MYPLSIRYSSPAVEIRAEKDKRFSEYGVAMLFIWQSPVACMVVEDTAAAAQHVLAVEYHSVDVPWWDDMVIGLPKPPFKTVLLAPDAPGLGIEALNDEVLRQHINPDIPGIWENTDKWNREFSNDRIWS